MKSKSGNKLKKIRGLVIAAGLALTGCLTEPKTIYEDHEAPASCLQYNSTTWTDTSEVTHMSCTINPGRR
jgi:hypothetical protein